MRSRQRVRRLGLALGAVFVAQALGCEAASAQIMPGSGQVFPGLPPSPVAAPAIPTADEEAKLVADTLQESADYYFLACDGFSRPQPSGDSMTTWSFLSGITQDKIGDRVTPAFFEPHDIASCGAALSDMKAFPQFWLRKVSLLRSRALHRLALGDSTGALRDLDAADEAAVDKTDPYYLRSLKMGDDLVRAYVLRQSGAVAQGDAMAISAWSVRPYDRETGVAALIAMGQNAPPDDAARVMRGLALVFPSAAGMLFNEEFEHGLYAPAIEDYGAITPTPKLGNEPMSMRDRLWLEQSNRATAEVFWAHESGRYAYALAAIGKLDEARAALAAARARYEAAMPDPPASPPGASIEQQTRLATTQQANLAIKTSVPPVLDAWARLVNARCDLAEGHPDAAWMSLTSGTLVKSKATLELIDALAAKLPEHAAQVAKIRAAYPAAAVATTTAETTALFNALPQAQTRGRLPAYHEGWNWGGAIRVKTGGDDPAGLAPGAVVSVSILGIHAPFADLEEAALLKAADIARNQGKNGLLVLAVRNIHHTLTTTMYGRPIRTTDSGDEIQLEAAVIDPAAPPPALAHAAWRVLDAARVYAALAPIYLPKPGTGP